MNKQPPTTSVYRVRYKLVPVQVEGAKERIPGRYGHLPKDVETWARAVIWARGRLEPGQDLSCTAEELIGDAICTMSNLRRVMGNPSDEDIEAVLRRVSRENPELD